MRKRKPKFRRQEWFRYRRLGEKWRRPKGKDSKMRLGIRGKPPLVSVGYRGKRSERGLHPSGLQEVLVSSGEQLKGLDPRTQAVRIAASVGRRKKEEIMKLASEIGVRVLNPGVRKVEPEGKKEAGG
ncbi:MAG: 50S ribosomal protein L32e [Candidatus Hadarchaeales archaeon]